MISYLKEMLAVVPLAVTAYPIREAKSEPVTLFLHYEGRQSCKPIYCHIYYQKYNKSMFEITRFEIQ